MGRVKIEIDGLKNRDVLNVRYSFRRQVDSDGQPTSKVTIDGIYVRMKSLEGDGTTDFPEWMCSIFKPKNGKLVFHSTQELQQLKELSFERAYLVYYQESFDEATGFYEEIEISPKKVNIGDAELEELWGDHL
jgi:hypothetical protein